MPALSNFESELRSRYGDLLGPSYPSFSAAEMQRREALVGDMMAAQGLDALIVAEAMRAGTATGWLTGWPVTAEAVTVVVPGAPRRMFVQHYNHLPLARRLAWNTEVLWGEGSAIGRAAEAVAAATSDLAIKGRASVGVIGRMPAAEAERLAGRFRVVDMNRAYAQLRMIKSEEEVRWLSLAAGLTDLAVLAFAERARPGRSERELIAQVQESYLALGGTNFIHYVHSTPMDAPDVAVPRQFPSARVLQTGDVLSCELSVDFWGYTGQILRTFFLGTEPDALYRELHAVADQVLDAVLARVKPGTRARELVEASRGIEDAGFTVIDDLVHGYGGGYLPPVLGTASRPSAGIPDLTLQAGMALVVQPNVTTRDGTAGVQTGNLVLVTETGWRSLQQYPRGWRVL
ncbi:M24 family metallopeptidase [Rhodoplanes sp. TEM]|uniref:M24 family metallopeptidase n=1 Tax=Rhodoplanes tepidamans TaxID=200616 RepID=A0ABT5JGQ8_RHOTP|nr:MULTISPECIES: M24 family metallopeptidase [Rhodoplanes]MDC7788889.1 M24 family metallopeptidase [Rhodoplanes tepidamans]MDC7985596.1 M24 family metallopeptidase [Rhodoplanes sp. TEM]MDQ0358777.1 Xaa-Pro aminopeptidase [Rhodoplanes tepidamans]